MAAAQSTDGVANGDVRARADDIVEDVKDLGRDLKGLAAAASERAQEKVREASEKLNEASRQAGEKLTEATRAARVRATEGAGRAADEVRAHPGAAIGLALGAGLLLGLLFARKR